MTKLTIAVDVDDVCADLVPAWQARYNRDYGDNITPEHWNNWDIVGKGLVKPECGPLIYDYLKDWNLYDDVKPVEGALEAVEAFRAAGHRVLFVTSCGYDSETITASAGAKLAWLQRHGFLPDNKSAARDFYVAADKTTIRADLIVDDRASTVAAWGRGGILFARPHNQDATEFDYRVPSWPVALAVVDTYLKEVAPPVSEGSKPSNPKDIIGTDKLPLHLVPVTAIAEESLAMLDGALKYGRDNFRAIGVRTSIYVAAALRHLFAYNEGEDIPADSRASHLAHARACLGIIIDAGYAGKLTDDRKVRGGYHAAVAALSPRVAEIRKLHEGKTPKHYTMADNDAVAA